MIRNEHFVIELRLELHNSEYYPDEIVISVERRDQMSQSLKEKLALFIKTHLANISMNLKEAEFSGELIISVENISSVLDALVSLKKEFSDVFTISQLDLLNCLNGLNQRNHLSSEQTEKYFATIPSEITLNDLENIALRERDFDKALEIAYTYNQDQSDLRKKYALYWLLKAYEFSPGKMLNLSLRDFFTGYSHLMDPRVFKEEHTSLVQQMADYASIKTITFQDQFEYINRGFVGFVSRCKTLNTITLDHVRESLTKESFHALAWALSFSKSIETVSLINQPIGDEEIEFLFDKLEETYDTKLKVLNLINCFITDRGAKTIINYLRERLADNLSVFDAIHLKGNPINASLLNEIYGLTGQSCQFTLNASETPPEILASNDNNQSYLTHRRGNRF